MLSLYRILTFAAGASGKCQEDASKPGELDLCSLPNLSAISQSRSPVEIVLKIVFGLAGAVALLIIILAGIKYMTSQGEPDKVARAKDTILYAAIGLAISLSAYGIVTLVINKIAD